MTRSYVQNGRCRPGWWRGGRVITAALLLPVAGLGLASLVSAKAVAVAILLLPLIVMYTRMSKHVTVLACMNLGACRAVAVPLFSAAFLVGVVAAAWRLRGQVLPAQNRAVIGAWLRCLILLQAACLFLSPRTAGLGVLLLCGWPLSRYFGSRVIRPDDASRPRRAPDRPSGQSHPFYPS